MVDEEINKPTGYKRAGEEMAGGDAASSVFECNVFKLKFHSQKACSMTSH